ncbi:MAG: hypothetical protein R3E48_21885 [Burkholderiaceae bacterium]
MSAFENAAAFFHACESLKGWAGCQGYVADGAGFDAQSATGRREHLGLR